MLPPDTLHRFVKVQTSHTTNRVLRHFALRRAAASHRESLLYAARGRYLSAKQVFGYVLRFGVVLLSLSLTVNSSAVSFFGFRVVSKIVGACKL